MIIRTIIFFLAISFFGSKATAQTDSVACTENFRFNYSIGLQTGLDIGAAVPYPLSAMGSDSKMSATPTLFPQLGLVATARVAPKWTVTMETTYKQVGVDAKARVSQQQFIDYDNPDLKINFRGSVEMSMSFSMLEIPIYAGYDLGGNEGRVILGAYYSRIFKGNFSARPLKGVLTPPDDPNDITEVDKPMDTQYFDDNLSKWDWGLLAGYEMKIFDRATLAARLSMGMKDIFRSDARIFEYKMLHMRGTVVVAYKLFKN